MPRRNEMEINVTGNLTDIVRSLTRLEKKINQFSDKTEKKLTKGFSHFLKFTIPGINQGVQLITRAFQALGRALAKPISTSAEFEFLETRLTSLFGSVKEGAKAFEMFNTFAAKTPFQLNEVVEAGATLQAFLGKEADSRTLIGSIGDLAAFMGVSIPQAASAFGRAFSAGVGAADMLRDRGILQLIKSFHGIEDLTKLTLPEFRKALVSTLQDPTLGIVGSTERLSKTWIGAVSNMQDALARMWDAIGDRIIPKAREFLAIGKSIVTSIEDWVRVPLSENLRSEQIEFNALVEILKSANTEQSTRNHVIQELQENYAGYIGNIDLESASVKQLADKQREANAEFEKKIRLAASEELLSKAFKNTADIQIKLAEAEIKLAKMREEGVHTMLGYNWATGQATTNVSLQAQTVANLKNKLGESSEEYKELVKRLTEMGFELDATTGNITKHGEEVVDTWTAIGDGAEDAGEKTKKTKEITKEWAIQQGLASESVLGAIRRVISAKFSEMIAGLLAKEIAFKGILGLITGAAGAAAAAALFASVVPKFGRGADFMTRRPQLIMVGESGEEHVKITPTPGGGSPGGLLVQLIVQGGLIDGSYLRNTFIPALNRVLSTGGARLVGNR